MKVSRSTRFFKGRIMVAAATIMAVGSVALISAGPSAASSSHLSASLYAKFLAAPKSINVTTPLKTPAPKGKSIVYIINSIQSDVQIGESMKEASEAIGWKYSQINYDPSNPATIQEAFSSALVEHPTIVAIGGVSPTQFGASTLKSYAKAGIPIIAASTWPVHVTKTLLGTPNSELDTLSGGVALADWFAVNSDSTGSALLVSAPIFPIFDGFVSGFEKQMNKICSTCTATSINLTAPELGNGTTISTVVTYLQAHPTIKYVFFCLGNFADGITSALTAAGLSDVQVGGQNIDPEGAADLKAGTESVWTGASNYYTGLSTIDFALRTVEHMSTVQDLTNPYQLLTKANIGNTTNWNAPYNALAQFEKLWKVPVTKCTVACTSTSPS